MITPSSCSIRRGLKPPPKRARAEELLDNILPASVADELKRTGRVQPKYTRSATILFADFHDFSLLAERTEPVALVGLLDRYFSAYCLELLQSMAGCRRATAAIRSIPAWSRAGIAGRHFPASSAIEGSRSISGKTRSIKRRSWRRTACPVASTCRKLSPATSRTCSNWSHAVP